MSALDDAPLSPSERYILSDFIQRFIQGLADKSLLQEAINQNVLAADSLRSAFERIRQAGSIQNAKTQFARTVARDTKISLMEEYIRQSSGCSANEELSRAYRLPASGPSPDPDSHGDIWLQIVTVVSQKPDKFQGKGCEILREMAETLELTSESGVPVARLVTLWRNEKWRKMVTARCETAVGRATFKIRPWSLMIACRIEEFWFSIFRQVLDTLADLPGDAASYVKAEDWKECRKSLNRSLARNRSKSCFTLARNRLTSPVAAVSTFSSIDREAYWRVYEHVVNADKCLFQTCIILSGVMDHVADRLSSDRSKRPHKRDNNKPGLRVDMVAALQHFDENKLQQAKGRVTTSIAEARGQSVAETTSIVMQQELLEFLCGRLDAFGSAPAKDQLTQRLDTDNAGLYRTRFRQAEWAGVLGIVRWYMGPEFRPEWPRPEDSRSGDVSLLVDVAIQNWKDITNLAGDKMRYSKLSSASFRDNLASWLGEKCGAGEASSPSGPTTGETNADVESVASISTLTTQPCSTDDRRQVSAGTDVGGEEKDLPSFVDAPDPGSVFDEAMAKAGGKDCIVDTKHGGR
ncbi:hypothetical protein E4U35_002005 [Claviceps purpurea]|nr:hypothetical protein E4U35_002005 [Claviceps purpurea]